MIVQEITNYFKKTDEYHTMQGRIEEVDRVNNASKPKQARYSPHLSQCVLSLSISAYMEMFSNVMPFSMTRIQCFLKVKSLKIISRSRKKIQANGWYQMVENLQRSFLNTVRNPSYTRMRIFQTLVGAWIKSWFLN